MIESTHKPGDWMWCGEDGRETCRIGGLTVYLSPSDRAGWNDGQYDSAVEDIRCHIPTHEPDYYDEKRGEQVLGLPTDWWGTIGDAIKAGLLEADYYEKYMDCVPCIRQRDHQH